jgi:hypothetical protein
VSAEVQDERVDDDRHPAGTDLSETDAESPFRRDGETEGERLDRNYGELLQELRVTQTGTQILFAFLLTIAFTPVFADAGPFTHRIYAATLVLCALATALCIAPVALHRTTFQRGLKRQLVSMSNRFALAGVYVLLLAVAGALVIALDTVLSRPVAVGVSVVVALVTVGLWVVLPVVVRVRYDSWGDGVRR